MTAQKIFLTDPNLTEWQGVETDGTDITVECIGGGGGGDTLDNRRAGGGGGYAVKTVSYVSKSTVPVQIGTGGNGAIGGVSDSVDGGNTVWNTNVITAYGGKSGKNSGIGGAYDGSGVTGYTGGVGSSGVPGDGHTAGGGGGGAAGPDGNGANGGLHAEGGGGGGGANGGTVGADAGGLSGANGGDNHNGTGHGLGDTGSGATAGTDGGGGGGGRQIVSDPYFTPGENGGNGTEFDATHGCGGGGGGGGDADGHSGGNGGLYGGGGGGGREGIASNSNGAQGLIVITYEPVPAPAGLTYSENPASYPVNSAITPNTPSSTGGAIDSYSVDIPLPTGLSLDPDTGIISGTPTAITASATYTITGTNNSGSTTCEVVIEITAVPTTPRKGIHYSVEIYTDDGTPAHDPLAVTDVTLGLVNGVLRYVTDRPKYDGSTAIPAYGPNEIDIEGNATTGGVPYVFYENFLQKAAFVSNPSNEIDLSRSGDIATLSGLEFIITNSAAFWNSLLTAGPGGTPIHLSGRKVRYSIFLDDVMYARWQGVIINNPYDEIDYHFACGPDINVHKMIPPNVINVTTFPNVGVGSQQTSEVQISGAITPESNIPANVTASSDPVPVCFGDVAYAQLFNVDGIPVFEKIAIIGRGISSISPFFNMTCAAGSNDTDDGSKGDGATGFFNGTRGGAGFLGGLNHNVEFVVYDFGYALFLISEDLSTTYPPGYASDPVGFTVPSNVSNLYFPTDYFKDYFIFKQGDSKGIRILHSTSSYITYACPSPGTYRYIYVNILTLAEKPEDFTNSNILLAPGNGWTVTDKVSVLASPLISSLVVSDTTIFFQVCKNIIRQIVSNFPIIKYNHGLIKGLSVQNGLPILRSFSSNLKLYENVCNLIGKATATQTEIDADIAVAAAQGIVPVSFPHLQLKASSDVQQNGISLLTPILIPATAIKSIDYTYLYDSGTALKASKSSEGSYLTNNIGTTDFDKLVDRNRNSATKAGGTFYPDICLTAAGTGGQVTITASGGQIISIDSIYNPGSGYVANQITKLSNPVGNPGVNGYMRVLTVDGSGGILTVELVNGGTDYVTSLPKTVNRVDNSGYIVTFSIDLTALIDIDADKAFFGIDFIATTPSGGVSGTSLKHLSFGIQFRLLDQYNRAIDLGIDPDDDLDDEMIVFRDPNGNLVTHTTYQQNNPGATVPINNLLPKDYYVAGGDDNDETDRFFLASYNGDDNGNAFTEIDLKKILSLIKSRIAQPTILVDVLFIGEDLAGSTPYWNTTDTILPTSLVDLNLKIKQIGFVAQKQISTANKALFAEVQGESVGNDGATETNSVHAAIRHILEDYDGIPAALIDYGNLATTRGASAAHPWYVGRQLTDRKNSLDYLQELCHQAFVGYFISRTGKHSFSAWRENTTTAIVHDESIINRGSISNWQKTDMSSLFNDFKLDYNRNPGLNKLDRSLIVTHVDDMDPGVTVSSTPTHAPGGGFPVIGCIDTDGVPLWLKYCSFPGIPSTIPFDPTTATPSNPQDGDAWLATATANGWTKGQRYIYDSDTSTWGADSAYAAAYTAAKALWDACHASWLETFTIQQTSGDLSALEWYNDRSVLSDLTAAALGVGVYSSAYMLLQNFIAWLTKQKDTVSYSVPINTSTVVLDLLTPVKFSDIKYTNNVQRLGWITRMSPDTENDSFNISLILDLV